MIDEEDDEQLPANEGMPFQYQLMEWCLIILTIVSLTAFFIMIVF